VHLVRAALTRRDRAGVDPAQAARVVDVLWAHAGAEDRLEHIRGRPGEGRVDLVLFFRTVDGADPARSAAELIARAYRSSAFVRSLYAEPELWQPAEPSDL
jgi:hypothetical protein